MVQTRRLIDKILEEYYVSIPRSEFGWFRPRLTPLGAREEEITLLREAPLLDRLLTPMLESLATTMARFFSRGDVAQLLRRAGFPYRTPADFYAAKAIFMVVLFLMGGLFVAAIGMPKLFIIPLALGAGGLFLPDIQVRRALKRRAHLIFTDMAFTLDRIAIAMRAGKALGPALHSVTAFPGGLFVAQLRTLEEDLVLGKGIREAMGELLARTPEVEALRSFADKCTLHMEEGYPLASGLATQAEMMRDQLNQQILGSGLANTLKITTIAGAFILPAVGIVVLGPSFWRMFQLF